MDFTALFKQTVARFKSLPAGHREDYARTFREQLQEVRRACANQPASTKAHLSGRFKTSEQPQEE